MLVLAGAHANLLARANTVVMSSSHPLLGPARLFDGRPQRAARFAAPAGAVEHVTVDLQTIRNGDFLSWTSGVPDAWTMETSGTATVTQDASVFFGGAPSAKLMRTDAGHTARVRQRILVRAGERAQLDFAIRGGTGATLTAYARNLTTGRYLASDGTWSATIVALAATSSSLWLAPSVFTTVEDMGVARADLVALELWCEITAGTGSAWTDYWQWIPAITFTSIHGHNLAPAVVVELRQSNDDFVSSDELVATLTIPDGEPAFYRRLAPPALLRYWRLKLTGTAYAGTTAAPLWLGEWVLGQPVELTHGFSVRHGWESRATRRQVRDLSAAGHLDVWNRTVAAERGLRLALHALDDGAAATLRRELLARSQDGALPSVVVPYYNPALTAAPLPKERTVVLGHFDAEWPLQFRGRSVRDVDVVLAESAFPTLDELG